MAKMNLEKTKSEMQGLTKSIEQRKEKLSDLEASKQEAIDIRMSLEKADGLDEGIRASLERGMSEMRSEVTEKGEKESESMGEEISRLEEMREELDRSLEENQRQASRLESGKKTLDKVGLGGNIEQMIDNLDQNRSDLESVKEELIDIQRNAEEVSSKLSML